MRIDRYCLPMCRLVPDVKLTDAPSSDIGRAFASKLPRVDELFLFSFFFRRPYLR